MVRFESLGKPVMQAGTRYRITWVSTSLGDTSGMVVLNFNDSDKPVATKIAGTSLYRYTYESTARDSFQYIVLYNLSNGIARDFTIYEITCDVARDEATFELGQTINFSNYTTTITNASMSTVAWENIPAGDYKIGLHVMANAGSGSMVRFTSLGKPVMSAGKTYKITWVSTYIGNPTTMVVLNFNDADKPVASQIAGTSLYRYTYQSTTSSSFECIVLYNLPNGEARDFTIYEITCELVGGTSTTNPVSRTDYHTLTYAEMKQAGGYTYDFTANNALKIEPMENGASLEY
jgi:hypothetical protein